MYFKILNKNNLIDASLPIANKYALSNLKAFQIDENSILIENYNEQLDSMNIRTSHQTSKLDIEPYDKVIIYDGDTTKYFCVDTYTCREETMNQGGNATKYYSYDISLFSETKLLEGVILPNLSITQLKTNKRSIYFYINEYMKRYCPKIRTNTNAISKSVVAELTPNETDFYATFTDTNLIGKTIKSSDVSTTSSIYNIVGYTISLDDTTGEVTIEGDVDVAPTQMDAIILVVDIVYYDIGFKNEFSISLRVIQKFSGVECPEKQWNAPTLREVLSDLFMIKDCIPIIRNSELDYIDLTQKNNAITNYNYIQESQSSEDYISDIKMNLQNVMQTSVDGIDTVVSTVEYLPLMADNYQVTNENMSIKTQFPILNIKHLWLCQVLWKSSDNTSASQIVETDLCNIENMQSTAKTSLVVESKEWETKQMIYTIGWQPNQVYQKSLQAYGSNDISNFYSLYKNFYLHFTRGTNTISGFTQLQGTTFWTQQPTWKWIRALAGSSQVKNGVSPTSITYMFDIQLPQGKPYYSFFFKVEYETLADAVFQAGKSESANKKVIVDNQTNSWVDAYSQGNLEYQKANRLGNKGIMINQRVDYMDNAIKIGDYLDDYIIYQVQYQIHSSHIEVNASACKDYILKDYFTGVNSKIRTWVNAQDEALIRHDLDKYYCEFSFRNYGEAPSEINSTTANDYLSPLKATQQTSKIKQAMVRTQYNNAPITPASYGIALNQITRLCGNSIVHTFGFSNNASADKNVDTTIITTSDIEEAKRSSSTQYSAQLNKDLTSYGGVPLQDVYYVEGTNYEYDFISILLTNSIDPANKLITMPDNLSNFSTDNDVKTFFIESMKHPMVVRTAYDVARFSKQYRYLKDNREIPKISVQFEMCSDTRDIYFTKNYLANHVDLLNESKQTLHIYKALKSNYVNGATSVGNEWSEALSCDFRVIQKAIQFVDDNTTGAFRNYAYAIGTSKNNILFGFKPDTAGNILFIYLNVLKERSKKVYNDNGIVNNTIQKPDFRENRVLVYFGSLGNPTLLVADIDHRPETYTVSYELLESESIVDSGTLYYDFDGENQVWRMTSQQLWDEQGFSQALTSAKNHQTTHRNIVITLTGQDDGDVIAFNSLNEREIKFIDE